jgi:electron transport complex protein RnfD
MNNSSPYIRSGNSELGISVDFIIAALPAIIWSAIAYGARPIAIVILSIGFSLLFDYLFCLVFKKDMHLPTAAVIGMITAMFMPAGISYWIVPATALLSLIVRRLTRGILHPIASALLPFFFIGQEMTAHTKIFESLKLGAFSYADRMDELAVTMPVDILTPENGPNITAFDAFIGNAPEAIGTMSAILILLGGIYLMVRGNISWHTPVGIIAGASLVWFFMLFDGAHYNYLIYHLCSGGVFLAAFFAATEYSSSPTVKFGRLVHGIACGILLMLLRTLGINAAMSVVLAMIIVSLFSRVIDMITCESYFGHRSKKLANRLKTLLPNFKK